MEHTKLLFCGTNESETNEKELCCYVNTKDEIYISIVDTTINNEYYGTQYICLNKATAIKLHKELKKQISYIQGDVQNG